MKQARDVWGAALVLAVLSVAKFTVAQQPPASPPGIPEAMARMQAQDPAGAAAILEGVTTREPGNGRAWRLYGVALQQSKQLEKALDAFEKALANQSDPSVMINIGAVHAMRKETDRAFEWLAKARASRRVDMTAIQSDPILARLKDDPRFAPLMPTAADFERPFVEETRIIGEWKGEAMNDQFGWIARDIGDVDGDRVADFVTSAPGHSTGGASAGRVYVYSTKSGRLLWKADGAAGDRLGTGLEAAGDVNRDRVADVIAGAPGSNRATVYSGNDGAVLLTVRAPDAGGNAGGAVSGAGDVNGDGHADLIVGAPPARGAAGPGAAYVFSGKDGALLLTLKGERDGDGFGSAVAGHSEGRVLRLVVGAPQAGPTRTGRTYVYDALSAKPMFTIDSDERGAALGAMFVAVVGDVDGDRISDVYSSDFPHRAKGPATGRVYVHSGKDGRRLLTLTGETEGEGFGTSPAKAGDVNGDGHADLAVGAWQYAGSAPSGGRVYLHSGKDGSLLRTFTCRIPGDTLGFDAVGIGDADGDGTIDLLLTSAYSGISGFHSGRVFIVSSGVSKSGR